MEENEPKHIDLSIVIPVHNEEEILATSVTELCQGLTILDTIQSYELILVENGSIDSTRSVAQQMRDSYPEIRLLSLPEPNYGAALRYGIIAAKGRWVLCDEIDLCDLDFYTRALGLLEADEADMVVGSKAMPGAEDKRPFIRQAATVVLNRLLRLLLGFKGTDTHGMKAFCRVRLLGLIHRCRLDKDLFASEFVIRAQVEDGVRVKEIPLHTVEKRRPSIALFRRVPNVLKGLVRLIYVMKFEE